MSKVEPTRSSLQRLLDIEAAARWIIEDASYKAPEEWNDHMERWYSRLVREMGET